jgi:hypothetical protein
MMDQIWELPVPTWNVDTCTHLIWSAASVAAVHVPPSGAWGPLGGYALSCTNFREISEPLHSLRSQKETCNKFQSEIHKF